AVDIGGFSFVGPVIIPHVINRRESQKKVFFFASSEYTKDIRPTAVHYTLLPTALERAGDFSQSYYCANASSNPCTVPIGTSAAAAAANPAAVLRRLGGTPRLHLTNPYAT